MQWENHRCFITFIQLKNYFKTILPKVISVSIIVEQAKNKINHVDCPRYLFCLLHVYDMPPTTR